MVAAGGTADQLRLQQILRKRLLCSEGVESSHCYTKEAAQGSADAVAEVAQSPDSEVGRRFSLDASDTPPMAQSPRGSPLDSMKETCGPEAWKANEDEAESTDGLPDQAEEGDLHYDWQFELMNSMPREKALELARVLKRSEQEKAKESAKLRQEVVELKRQMSNKQDLREGNVGNVQRTSCISWRCMAFLVAVVVAAVGIAMKVTPQLGESRLVALQAAEEKLPTSTTTTMTHQELTPPEAIEKSRVTPAPSTTVVPEAVAAPAATPMPPMPPVHSPMPKPPVLGAKVISGVSHTHLWHQALSQDATALGPAKDATMKASLKAVGSNFPKVTEAYRFLQLDVSRALLDGRQVALQVTLQVLNVGVSTWPERTSLKLIHGVGMGLPSLMVGQKVLPGQHIDLSLQLEVPNRGHGDGNDLMRNMWVLVGRNDEPFGPLLVAEIRFTA